MTDINLNDEGFPIFRLSYFLNKEVPFAISNLLEPTWKLGIFVKLKPMQQITHQPFFLLAWGEVHLDAKIYHLVASTIKTNEDVETRLERFQSRSNNKFVPMLPDD